MGDQPKNHQHLQTGGNILCTWVILSDTNFSDLNLDKYSEITEVQVDQHVRINIMV